MRSLTLTAGAVWLFVLIYGAGALWAVPNGSFTATWDPPTDPRAVYEFRWRHFAQSAWQDLPEQDARALSFLYAYPALPTEPITDRWMCLDARSRLGDRVSAWLSDTADGAACNTVEATVIPVPTPPPPVVVPPPPAPLPPQPDIFTNLQQRDGRISIDYQIGACPRGVQQTTSAVKDGRKTITLTCRQ
jgi:hypothetical protein